MGLILKKSLQKSSNISSRYDLPYRKITFGQGYETLYLNIYDFDYVKNWIDYWGLLYNGEVKEKDVVHLDDIRKKFFGDDEKKERYISKVRRQMAREPFFNELETLPLHKMSANVRWVAELLIGYGLAELVL